MLYEWATRHGVGLAALHDLQRLLGSLEAPGASVAQRGASEKAVEAAVKLEASRRGYGLWRNQVGSLPNEQGAPVRFGLANTRKGDTDRMASADYVGIKPRLIVAADVGTTIGQFLSIETKHVGWRYSGTKHELAQQAWALRVGALGGLARFVTDAGQLP